MTSDAEGATTAARWLLTAAAEGLPLTQTHALARIVVREAAERFPGWWDAELFGPPHREADLAVLAALHDGLRRLRLVRRRGRILHTSTRGRALADDPTTLLRLLADDLGGGDAFADTAADAITAELSAGERTHEELTRAVRERAARECWRRSGDLPLTDADLSWAVSDVVCRGEAYGLIACLPNPALPRLRGARLALTAAARLCLATDARPSTQTAVLVFDADLLNARDVAATVAVFEHQPLTALHDAIQQAFDWYDDHLYSFWLDGTFWGEPQAEYTSPVVPDEAPHTADVPLSELGLEVGARIAYLFDFGDEWRVQLTLRGREDPDEDSYPRVLDRRGTAPPQYPGLGGN